LRAAHANPVPATWVPEGGGSPSQYQTCFVLRLVTLLATKLARDGALPMRQAAWYRKTLPTFSDALAAVRRQWWRTIGLSTSTCEHDVVKVPRHVFQRLHEAACYAA